MSVTSERTRLVFDVTGMDCGDCARSVERAVGQLPEVAKAEVSFGAATLTVDHAAGQRGGSDFERTVRRAVDRAGYAAILRRDGEITRVSHEPWWKSRKVLPAFIATLLWIAAFAVGHLTPNESISIALYVGAIVVGGTSIARAGIASLRALRFDMNVLMSISVVGAALLGEWSEAGIVVVLFTIGTTLQSVTFDRTRRALRELLDLAPEEANVVRDGVEMTVAASSLAVGDVVVVRPGDRLPADGEILEGRSALTQAAITGESMPADKGPGDPVFAGTINGSGTLSVRVSALSSESMLARIVHLVEEAQGSKAPSQQLVDRFAAIYTPLVVAIAGTLAVGGYLLTDDGSDWLYRALVLLVIACPCALVISTPVSIVSAIGAATRNGILVKGGAALEDMGRIRTIAFDKTGTLTLGRPSVTAVMPYGDATEAEVLKAAAAVERSSEHPLARAIVARALHDMLPVAEVSAFEAVPGKGARAWLDGSPIAVGSERFISEMDPGKPATAWMREIGDRQGTRGESLLAVATRSGDDTTLLGVISVSDRVRSEAAQAIAGLRELGVRQVVLLTGDRQAVAESVAGAVGADAVRAELLPHQKLDAIRNLRTAGPIAMVGDGINDAPALALADAGIAMGLNGTDVALESADLALMRDDLTSLTTLVRLAQRTLVIIRQNVALSLITKIAALVLGTFGFVNLWVAVLVDVGTSLLVTLNGLRLSRLETRTGEMRAAADHVEQAACGCCGASHAPNAQ
jgi:Cd2+/Zn2+-exporting ATPase